MMLQNTHLLRLQLHLNLVNLKGQIIDHRDCGQ